VSDSIYPLSIVAHQRSRVLEITFSDGIAERLSFEFLRVFSPSAEVRGHGAGQAVLQVGKQDVDVLRVESVGHYAIRLVFSDGHDSGIYSWDYLHRLAREQGPMWADYLQQLELAGASREARADAKALQGPPKSCSKT
jgi:DUF971 family protein